MRDIPRTYPELEFFKDNGRGQQALFNVIKAYSIHDTEVGYCQGSAFIVGQLLLQMPEEEAFAVFVRLMEAYRLRELFKPAMTELGLCMFQLECLGMEFVFRIAMAILQQARLDLLKLDMEGMLKGSGRAKKMPLLFGIFGIQIPFSEKKTVLSVIYRSVIIYRPLAS
ncbi:unnamed protein product [Gongylonema pulchrum]|uniref:Rab-GAP TBC domain-containing protein n=1 Tax=Gongylonema pulchrum TaxID=637853 RepID=A0A3P7M1V9_9BILA|nr:unnamed protein product [Gongylonema pulchrum]